MNALQNTYLKMYVAVTHIEEHVDSVLLQSIPHFTTRLEALKECLQEIMEVAMRQDHHSHKASADKHASRMDLEDKMFHIAAVVRAVAFQNNEVGQAASFRLSATKIHRFRDIYLIAAAHRIANAATTRITDLQPFGVTSDDITALREAKEAFQSIMYAPRENTIKLKNATSQLQKLFTNAFAIIKYMDILAETRRKTHPGFYAWYRACRRLYHHGHRTTLLMGIVTGEKGNALPLTTITIDALNLRTKSSAKGKFRFPKLPEGLHIIRAHRAGYDDVLDTVRITKGTTTRTRFRLERMGSLQSQQAVAIQTNSVS